MVLSLAISVMVEYTTWLWVWAYSILSSMSILQHSSNRILHTLEMCLIKVKRKLLPGSLEISRIILNLFTCKMKILNTFHIFTYHVVLVAGVKNKLSSFMCESIWSVHDNFVTVMGGLIPSALGCFFFKDERKLWIE